MRSGEEGPVPVPSACPLGGLPAPPSWASTCCPLTPPPHRYGGFSLGGREPGLPSGQEVSRLVNELQVLLSPPPGGALDRILRNLTAWAHSLDTEDSLKVGPGAVGSWLGGAGPTPAP